jgi:hypothetical protein
LKILPVNLFKDKVTFHLGQKIRVGGGDTVDEKD